MFETTTVEKQTKVVVETPTFDHALSIFGYHLNCIAVQKGKFGLHFYGDISVEFEVILTLDQADLPDETNRMWDQVRMDGRLVGNRCAAREAYVKLCSPYLMRLALSQPIKK